MQDIQLFDYQSKEVRVVLLQEETWFVAKDVFSALDLDWRGVNSLDTRNIPQGWRYLLPNYYTVKGDKDTWFINERAIYKLAFRSNKSEADEFTNWVTSVIQKIRKTGKFELQQSPLSTMEIMRQQLDYLIAHEKQLQQHQAKLDDHETRLNEIEAKIKTTNKDYFSLAGYYALQKRIWNLSNKEAQNIGKSLTKASQDAGFAVIKVQDSKYGEVNGYHKDVLAKGLGF